MQRIDHELQEIVGDARGRLEGVVARAEQRQLLQSHEVRASRGDRACQSSRSRREVRGLDVSPLLGREDDRLVGRARLQYAADVRAEVDVPGQRRDAALGLARHAGSGEGSDGVRVAARRSGASDCGAHEKRPDVHDFPTHGAVSVEGRRQR